MHKLHASEYLVLSLHKLDLQTIYFTFLFTVDMCVCFVNEESVCTGMGIFFAVGLSA